MPICPRFGEVQIDLYRIAPPIHNFCMYSVLCIPYSTLRTLRYCTPVPTLPHSFKRRGSNVRATDTSNSPDMHHGQLSLAIAVLGTGNSIMSSLVIGIVSRRQSNTSTMEHKTCTRGNLCVFSSFSASTLHALVCLAIPVTWEQSLPLITQCYLDVGQTGWWTQPNVSCRWRTVPNTFLTL